MENTAVAATTILENSPIPFVALDRSWRFAYVNRKAEELLQMPRTELLGKNVRDVFPDNVIAPFQAAYLEAAGEGTITRFEARYGPRTTVLELHVYPSETGWSIFFHEVTDREETEAALRNHEQRFRAVWHASSDAMALSDPHGTVLDVNPAYLEIYGYTYEEVVGHNFAIIFPEHIRPAANEQYRETFNTARPHASFESVIQRKDGSERVVEARADYIEENGQRVAMLSSIRDITERVRQAEALRESEERFRLTFDSAPIGMALVGLDFKPIRANSALCRMLGYSEQELTELSAIELTHPEDIEADMEMAEQLLRGEIPRFTIEKRYLTKSSDIVWGQLSVSLVRDKDENILYALSMVEDITERKRSEEERARLLSQEQDARALAERAVRAQEELLSLVSHDLRNPIAVVKGVTQLIQRRIARGNLLDVEQLNSEMTKLAEAVARMDKFIEDLSTPQHLAPGQPLSLTRQRVDLVHLAQRVAESHRQESKQHRLVIEAESPEVVGSWDPVRLEQVLDNLITNAVKYSPQGGVVKISVGYEGNRPSEPTAANPQDKAEEVRAFVSVRDKGMGIPADDLSHIFEWYRRGSNVRETIRGSGVGLAGARQIVEQHGGHIAVESQEGAGSAFTILLPLGSYETGAK
jgi:PAS domain S-box-containing protein